MKLTFPVYKEGADSREWLRDCEEYFSIYEVNDGKRAAIAAMNLVGTPRSWYKSFMIGHDRVTWQQFSEAFIAKFGDIGDIDTNLVFDKFKKLQQLTSVEDYYDEFEKCRGQLPKKIPGLTVEYFLENFIGGLQNEIKGMIRLLEPNSLEQALKLARYYEQTLNAQPKKYNSFGSGSYKAGTTSQTPTKGISAVTGGGASGKAPMLTQNKSPEVMSSKPRPLTYSQREERRQKGLCFYCDEKFIKGHECKKPQNFLMVSEIDEEEFTEEPRYDENLNEVLDNWKEHDIILTTLGVDKGKYSQPLQFKGVCQGRDIKVLIDSGSTLNLVNDKVCSALGLEVEIQPSMVIKLPNGA